MNLVSFKLLQINFDFEKTRPTKITRSHRNLIHDKNITNCN